MHSSKPDVTSYPALPLPAAPRSDSTWRKTLLDRSLALISPRPANGMQVVMKSWEAVASYVGLHSNICYSSRSGITLHQGISRVALPTQRVATTSEGSNRTCMTLESRFSSRTSKIASCVGGLNLGWYYYIRDGI
ncbi:hypothetical protein E2C01_091951 [Portunus trituberculatus]|uniref:Uncharacterized protein n=1 Tax=Portunus trituberculatus TaxID=210409 RepID=A0A5B7JUA8_PORTR|nr:hypothetical protein [Portunus trituberculatus]